MSIYRQYENPWELEDKLKELKEELHRAYALGADMDELEDLNLEIHELKERINFAWQDNEAEMEGYE